MRALLRLVLLAPAALAWPAAAACVQPQSTIPAVAAEIAGCVTAQTAPSSITPTILGGVLTDMLDAESAGAAAFLQKSYNLSDLASAATARTNLGLGSAATLNSSAFLQSSNNLSDLASAATARANLGLGSAATQASTTFLQKSNNLSDLANAPAALAALGLPNRALSAWLDPTQAPYTVKCDGVTDDAAALNTFFAAAPANSGVIFPPAATCVFKSALTLPLKNNIILDFNGATLLYKGASTSLNAVSWGVTGGSGGGGTDCSAVNGVLRNIVVDTQTVMTGGDLLRLNDLCWSFIENAYVGNAGNTNPYNGCHINGGNDLWIVRYSCKGSHAGEVDNGDSDLQATDLFHLFGVTVNSGYGILIAGNCGGCYWDMFDDLNNNWNVRIDQSVAGVKNNQVRFGPNFASDGATTGGVDLEDDGSWSGPPYGIVPTTLTANASFAAAASSISVAACATIPSGNIFVMDNSLSPPRKIGLASGCSSGSLALSGSGARYASAGSADSLVLAQGPGPGQSGSQLFFEGTWVSTAPTCLKVGANIDYEIHLVGIRMENCATAGIVNNSNLLRMYIDGGTIGQNGYGVDNLKAGAMIEFQARPGFYGNGNDEFGLQPTASTGCGTGPAVVGDDYDFFVEEGSGASTSCALVYEFEHDRSASSISATAQNASAVAMGVAASLTYGATFVAGSPTYFYVRNGGSGF